jgi:hypothetical protein
MCAGPPTWPQIKRLSSTFLIVKLAKGLLLAVGIDMSTMQCCREVIDAGTEDTEPEDGSIMCRP